MLLEGKQGYLLPSWGVGGLLRNFPSRSMCIKMGKSKRKERDRRREEIQGLASSRGLQVAIYNWGRHYRITGGEQAIDYWPGSGTCWVTGSMTKGIKMEPNEAIALAIAKPPLPEGAEEHLKEIRSSAVAEGEIRGKTP